MLATKGEKIFYNINNAVLFIFTLSCLIPLLYTFSMSFSSAHAVTSGFVFLYPVEFTAVAYRLLLEGANFGRVIFNSLIITSVGIAFSMVVTIITAYPLSRKYLIFRRKITLFLVFTMLFGGGAIPGYLLVRSLGMMNTYWALWIPGLINTYNVLVMKTSFEGILEDLEDAARIDGASDMRILLQIILPLSKPILATFTLFYGVGYWNNFSSLLIFINDSRKWNLAVFVQNMIRNQEIMKQINQSAQSADLQNIPIIPESLKNAGVMVMLTPMLLAYPFLQKYFVKGVMLGAIKG